MVLVEWSMVTWKLQLRCPECRAEFSKRFRVKYSKKVDMASLTLPDLTVAFSKVTAPDGHDLNLLTVVDLVSVEEEV